MEGLDIIGEIYDALADEEMERFFDDPGIIAASYTYQKVIEKHVPDKSMDNAVAAVSQYGIACNRAGFEAGFKIAWKIVEQMRTNK